MYSCLSRIVPDSLLVDSVSADFVMAELQEKESIVKNLRSQLDQEISNGTRLAEANRSVAEQSRLSKSDHANQISHLRLVLVRYRQRCDWLIR